MGFQAARCPTWLKCLLFRLPSEIFKRDQRLSDIARETQTREAPLDAVRTTIAVAASVAARTAAAVVLLGTRCFGLDAGAAIGNDRTVLDDGGLGGVHRRGLQVALVDA